LGGVVIAPRTIAFAGRRATVDKALATRLGSAALARRSRPRPGPATPPSAAVAPAPAARAGGADRPWAEVACAVVAFAVYLATLAPTVVGGDSGELIAVGATLGVAHPPGYPLYTLLAKLFTFVPGGSVAQRVNLLSAVCGALAAGLLCRAVRRLTGDAWCGAAAAGLLAFSPLVWPYAVTAEVFPLNNLMVAALLLLLVEADRVEGAALRRGLCAFALVSGLALSNHHTSVFVIAPFGAYLLWRARMLLDARLVALVAGAGLVGLLPYAYLPWAAARHPAVAFGDPSTWSGFWAHLLRQEYGTFRLASEETGAAGDWGPRVAHVVSSLARSTFLTAPLLALASLPAALRPRGRLVGLVAGTLALYVLGFAALANVRWDDLLHRTVQDRFWQQAVVLAAALAGVGLGEMRARMGRAGGVLAPVAAVGIAAAMAVAHFEAANHRGRVFFRDYGHAILDALPQGTILLVTSDEAVGAVRYLQAVEGQRPDVRILPTGQVTRPWLRPQASRLGIALPEGSSFTARAFLDANVPRAPVFVVNRVPWLASLEEAYALWPVGLVEELTPKGAPPALHPWVLRVEEAYARFDPRQGERFAPGSWERYVSDNAARLDRRFALALPRAAASAPAREEAAREVVRGLEAYVARQRTPDAVAHKNLGVAYQMLARAEPGALEQMARHWTIALQQAPNDPDRDAMRALIARVRGERAAPAPR
jgi:hypothetical protein